MGSSETMVVRSVVLPPSPPVTRLPTLTRWLLMRPESAAVMRVNSTLSCAERIEALADSTAAPATFRSETRWS